MCGNEGSPTALASQRATTKNAAAKTISNEKCTRASKINSLVFIEFSCLDRLPHPSADQRHPANKRPRSRHLSLHPVRKRIEVTHRIEGNFVLLSQWPQAIENFADHSRKVCVASQRDLHGHSGGGR